MADSCGSCGGVIGRDCFNPVECAEITAQIEADALLGPIEAVTSERDLYKQQRDELLAAGEALIDETERCLKRGETPDALRAFKRSLDNWDRAAERVRKGQ